MTPEGKIKAAVKKCLKGFCLSPIYEYWPVPYGFGPSSLDCLLVVNGHFIAVETKPPGGKPTPRQYDTMMRIKRAMGTVVVISDVNQIPAFEDLIRSKLNAPNPNNSGNPTVYLKA